MGFFSGFSDPLGILDFGKDQYNANRDYGHTREIMDSQNMFAERMSNTAYQRATMDMSAAGLNPMLAYQQGGAHSPGGQQAPVFNRGNSSAGAIQAAAQTENIRAQIGLVNAQKAKVIAETPGAAADSEAKRFNVDQMLPQEYQTRGAVLALKKMENQILSATMDPEIVARRAEASLREQGVPIELAKRTVELLLKRLDVPGARFKARGYEMSDEGLKGVKAFAEYAGETLGKWTNSAVDAARSVKHGYERFKSNAQYRRKYEFNR